MMGMARVFWPAACFTCLILEGGIACGLYGEEEGDRPDDPPVTGDSGRVDDGSGIDTSAADTSSIDDAGVTCHGAFGALVPIPSLSTAENEFSARFSQDQLTAYITRPDSPTLGISQIWLATRQAKTEPFSTAKKLTELGTSSESLAFSSVTEDQLSIFFQMRPQPDASASIFKASRKGIDIPFAPRVPVLIPKGEGDQLVAPYITPNGEGLWLGVSGSGGADPSTVSRIVRVPMKTAGQPWEEHFELAGSYPVVTPDEREIFFVSTSGAVLHSKRASVTEAFETPTILNKPLNSGNGFPAWISPDGCRLYLCLDQGTSKLDVFVMARDP
jgi:hypothetical protein